MAFDAEPAKVPRARLIASMIVFVLLMGATPALAESLGIEGLALLPFFLPALVALVWMSREVSTYARRKGNATPAGMAYSRRILPFAAGYVVVMLGAIVLHQRYHVGGPALYLLAILPSLPVVGIVWAMGRFLVEESDEYQRALTVRKMLIATGFMLVVVTVWGFLEEFALVAHFPAYWGFIVWCFGLGVGGIWCKVRA
jgi:hypothetical protein